MLQRTNIFLETETVRILKKIAEREEVTMSEVIRCLLKKGVQEETNKKNPVASLLILAKKAGGSGLKDVAKRHNFYLYGQPKHLS